MENEFHIPLFLRNILHSQNACLAFPGFMFVVNLQVVYARVHQIKAYVSWQKAVLCLLKQ